MTDRYFRRSGLARPFGGCFVAETLVAPLVDLERRFLEALDDASFNAQLDMLLRDLAGRPTPLLRARRLGDALGCELYLKREDLVHTGAHKLNNALGQCLLAQRSGRRRVLAETGAGQHGVATATAAAALGLECEVHMGTRDVERQATNVRRMELLGARVIATDAGDATLKEAVSSALRAWVDDPDSTTYVIGSALGPHPYPRMVAHFQRVIGDEARRQILERTGALPDVAVACVGGGSNAIGLFSAFMDDAVELVGVEAGGEGIETGRHAARMASGSTGGVIGVLHGSRSRLLQDADGQVRATTSISAGLDYPSLGPEHADLETSGRARYTSATDRLALEACLELTRTEGILPALESSHALASVRSESARYAGRRVLVCLSGRGDKDLSTIAEHIAAGGRHE
ncbi:Tryptophan synthase beta chain [Planctomycetes bacterium Pla163]|uniref:Tryptophan synthase beta chain n=1 Tax=Rohdeia mirabilis TaxID=2528008 RepID=A0A518CYT4_9BACT|nr:Tryptophan synthase beta chain [Planctomycetes bacterium Pla163]